MFTLVPAMKLEHIIKQTKPFTSENQKLVINIQVTSSWLQVSFSAILKPFGITPPQYNVLRILRGRHPQAYSNQDIVERMIDKSSNCTRIVDKLKIKGLIARRENKTDRRQVDISITDRGLKLLEEIHQHTNGGKSMVNKLSERKARLMNQWLDELRE